MDLDCGLADGYGGVIRTCGLRTETGEIEAKGIVGSLEASG